MTTMSAALRTCHEKVESMLRGLYGARLLVDEATPAFGLRQGSVFVNIAVRSGANDAPVVVTRAWLVTGTEPTQEFLHHLLSDAGRPPLGAYGLDANDDVYLEHAVSGEDITLAGLRASVESVASEGDRADDVIVARFGGIRMTDKRV